MVNEKNLKPLTDFKKESFVPKTYEQFLLEGQSEKDQKISESYQTEYETEASQGSQYGPGRQNFKSLYRRIKSQLGRPSCKVSYFSDNFDPSKNYAGMIVYSVNGNFSWMNTAGQASGYKGRSFYIIVQCTNNWPSDVLRDVGQGRVHHYLIKNTLGFDYDQDLVCCGGFSYVNGSLKFSSVWLNGRDQVGCSSDGSKYLSTPEQALVEYCFGQYRIHGKNSVFSIPDYIDSQLSY